MNKGKRYFHAAQIGLWIAFVLLGLSPVADPVLCYEKAVVDRTGARVCLPHAIEKIIVTCYGGASHEIALLGGADKIVAQPSVEKFPQFLKIYQGLANLPDAGSFNNINLEQIMSLSPDIVFASVTSTQGNRRIRELGIPVAVVGTGRTDINSLLKEFHMVGKILGTEKQAADLVCYWEKKLSQIHERTASIPGLKKKKVFYTSSGTHFGTDGSLSWGHHFIEASGGMNVAKDLNHGGGVTPEQLLVWNPDVIISSTNKSNGASADDIQNNPKFRNVKAVTNNAIYPCPIGTFWWDRPSPEAILGILWLAGTLYPDAMKGIDIQAETMLFYSRFYHYKLTEKEYNAFFEKSGQAKRK